MRVHVIGFNGIGLAPTTPRKARILLKEGRATRICKNPFTILLLYKTGCNHQKEAVGIDTGSQHIGAAVINEERVLEKAEYALRDSMEKRSLLETKKEYRRGRRYRKTRYRHPKFRPHTKRVYIETPVIRNKHKTHWKKVPIGYPCAREKGWLPPSIQSKVDHHIRIINLYLAASPKDTVLRIETARFDAARIKDPSVHGEMYQYGPMYDYENVKAYVYDRDGYACKICKKKAGSRREDGSVVKIRAHHIDFRSKGATDNPDRMATVCDQCHTLEAHQPGGILHKWMTEGKTMKRGYRDATFMNILRLRLWENFPSADFTYGNITNADRKAMGLPKTHANDAVAIACGRKRELKNTGLETVYYQQVRKKKRSLHEANPRKGRSGPNRSARRNKKNTKAVTVSINNRDVSFHLFDKVRYADKIGWISGFTGTSAYVKDADNKYIKRPDAGYNQISLSSLIILGRNNNWLVGARHPIGKG